MGAGGGERAPVALCREPTEPAGETRGVGTAKLAQPAGEKAKNFYSPLCPLVWVCSSRYSIESSRAFQLAATTSPETPTVV